MELLTAKWDYIFLLVSHGFKWKHHDILITSVWYKHIWTVTKGVENSQELSAPPLNAGTNFFFSTCGLLCYFLKRRNTHNKINLKFGSFRSQKLDFLSPIITSGRTGQQGREAIEVTDAHKQKQSSQSVTKWLPLGCSSLVLPRSHHQKSILG